MVHEMDGQSPVRDEKMAMSARNADVTAGHGV